MKVESKAQPCTKTRCALSLAALFLSAVFWVSPVSAVRLDCANATSEVEAQICSSPKLSALDDEMDQVYKEASKIVSDPTALKNAQQKWMMNVRNASSEPENIEAAYLSRIEELHVSPMTRGRLFARSAPPQSIYGRYSEKEPVCISIPDTDTYDCSTIGETESFIDIKPGPANSVRVKSKLIFFKGHTCEIQGKAEWIDGVLRLPRLDRTRCVLQLRFKEGKVMAEDPAGSCQVAFCQDLCGFQNIELPKTGHSVSQAVR